MEKEIKLQTVNFPGYEVISNSYNISAAVIVPRNARLLVTSGHVGLKSDGNVEELLEKQIDAAFENVEKSILAAAPSLTKEEAWKSVYQITTYHTGGMAKDVIKIMFDIAAVRMGQHAPAWTAVGVEDLAFGRFEITAFAAMP